MKKSVKKKWLYLFLIFIIILILAAGVLYYFSLNKINKTKLSPESSGVGLSHDTTIANELISGYPNYPNSVRESIQGNYTNLLLPSLPKQNGWIIEFKETPLAVKKVELEKSLPETLNKASKDVQIKSALDSQKQKILDEHANALNDINLKVKSISPTNQINVKEEYIKVFNGISVDASSSDIERIKSSSYVKRVYPNYEVHTTLMDSVPLINADDVWQIQDSQGQLITGKDIKIAIIDTGVDYTHSDLGGCFGENCKVVGGYDFINNDNDPMDDNGHGTHVASTAAGNGVLKGVAPDAKIYAYKVLDSGGGGYESQIISGIERAVDPNGDGDFSDHIDIISMSLGGPGNPEDPMSTAIDNVVDNGVVAVIATGNDGPSEQTIGSPGTSRKAITVGASNKSDIIASFSSRGPVIWTDSEGNEKAIIKPDIVAPGVYICAAQSSQDTIWQEYKDYDGRDIHCIDNKHIKISGTSMATPHVAGAVALIKQAHPDWTPEEIKSALKGTAFDIGENAITQGTGRIDVLDAIKLNFTPEMFWDFGAYSAGFKLKNVYNNILIKGIFPEVYDSLNVEWRKEGEAIWRTNGLNVSGSNNVIAEFNPDGIINETGNYIFNVQITKNETTKQDFVNIYFDKDLKRGWPQHIDNDGSTGLLPTIGDINGDSFEEIIFRGASLVHAYDYNGNKLKGFPVFRGSSMGTSMFLPPVSLGDIDRDCSLDIISGSTKYKNGESLIWNGEIYKIDSCAYAWSGNSSLLKDWPFNCSYSNSEGLSFGFSLDMISLYDLDKDGSLEIISSSEEPNDRSLIYAYHANGTLLKGNWPVNIPVYGSFTLDISPAIGDINNDGLPEISLIKRNSDFTTGIVIINQTGDIIINKRYWNGGDFATISPTILGDINNDGSKEIMSLIQSKGIYVFSSSGNLLKRIDTSQFYIPYSLILVDINSDRENEIIYGEYISPKESNLVIYSYKNGIVSRFPIHNDYWIQPTIADVNNDKKLDILINTEDGFLLAYDTNGTLIFKKQSVGALSGVVVGDLDKNNKLDIVVSDYLSNIYVWELNALYNKSNLPWSMFQHDPQHAGCYDCENPMVQCLYDSRCKSPTTSSMCNGNILITETTTPIFNLSTNACTNQTQKENKTCKYGCSTLETFTAPTLSQCNKVFLLCENIYYTAWSSTKCNAADCGKDKYVSCEKGGSPKKASYREKCSKTYSPECSETAKCNTGDKVIATKPC